MAIQLLDENISDRTFGMYVPFWAYLCYIKIVRKMRKKGGSTLCKGIPIWLGALQQV